MIFVAKFVYHLGDCPMIVNSLRVNLFASAFGKTVLDLSLPLKNKVPPHPQRFLFGNDNGWYLLGLDSGWLDYGCN